MNTAAADSTERIHRSIKTSHDDSTIILRLGRKGLRRNIFRPCRGSFYDPRLPGARNLAPGNCLPTLKAFSRFGNCPSIPSMIVQKT
jgi:hypothetical protein